MAGKDLDPIRARGALAVIKQHPLMVLFVASPGLILVALAWYFGGAFWGILLLVLMTLGAGYLVVRKR